MSAASCLLTEDHFLCSICLDVFIDPVTTPCGHNFCKKCITEHWNINISCKCPNCVKVFSPRPELRVNTLISEVVVQFRTSAQQKTNSRSRSQRNIRCHVCKDIELKALMFCLVFLVCAYILQVGFDHIRHNFEVELQQMIQKNQMKLNLIKHSVELSNKAADGEIADAVDVFTALKESIERSKAKLIETIEEKRRATETQAEGFIKVLEEEISELKQRKMEVEWHSVAHLEETLSKEMKKLLDKAELKRVQDYAVDVTLDPDTAHPQLILSHDLKQVKLGDVMNDLPDNAKRFTDWPCVLGKQSFSKGRFYYEVDIKDRGGLGVVRESIDRTSNFLEIIQGGAWMMRLFNERAYINVADSVVELSLKSDPEKVGVFVDYDEGLVSFYDVNTAALLHSFTGCSFPEKLYPYFQPFYSDDLIISPVIPQ
ncbi:E3 ubiquitin-protein ligase TRIM39-like [Seriola dumerili]|uniref:E3 ubiquitin-protein ligase TRIM39-like n=1 Tax=Seriola dumerili TaxID=41447 RepID=UPI000BBE884D|nr:E3 ubiquitin-protein ligase TRIM39-like [Seriola dumerili]